MLKIINLSVSYGELEVLRDVSISIDKGEIVSLLGSNGAGKTTLMNTIMGMLKPRRGEIYFNNENITRLKPSEIARRGLAIVPEGRRLFPRMTVLENLELGAYSNRADIGDRLEFVFSIFPVLKLRKNQKAGTLSGGEQQMLAIARALMSKPKMLLIDEMSTGLMPKIMAQLFRSLEKIRGEEGTTIFLSEQNARQALKISDRAYIMENGRIVLEGSADKLADDPRVKRYYLGL